MNSPGQLVSHMSRETFNLRHGFLSSYEVAIFARRLDDYRIELSPPIHRNAQHPSLRECFAAFLAMCNQDSNFYPSDGFSPRIVESSCLLPVGRSHVHRFGLLGTFSYSHMSKVNLCWIFSCSFTLPKSIM